MRVDRVSLTSADEERLPSVAIVQWERRRLLTLRSFRCATRFLTNGINRIMKSVIIKNCRNVREECRLRGRGCGQLQTNLAWIMRRWNGIFDIICTERCFKKIPQSPSIIKYYNSCHSHCFFLPYIAWLDWRMLLVFSLDNIRRIYCNSL